MELNGTTLTLLGVIISAFTGGIGFLGYITGKKLNEKKQITEETEKQVTTSEEIKNLKEKLLNLEEKIKETQVNPMAQAKMEMSLEYIKEGVDKINNRMENIEADAKNTKEILEKKINNLKESFDKKVNDLSERVTRTEESTKQSHKRIDDVENKFNLERK